MTQNTDRAVILGGGFTGLLAAKVLSEYYKEVIIIERDSKVECDNTMTRKGVPQGGFNHALIPMGIRAVEKLFPTFGAELIRNGGGSCDLCQDVRYMFDRVCKPRIKVDKVLYLVGRPLIDKVIRDLLQKCQNISFHYDVDAIGLLYDPKETRVTGAKLKDRLNHQESIIVGDLIVDATGPHSRSIEWLVQHGLQRPPIEEVPINYIQVAYRGRWREDFHPDWGLTIYRTADLKKGGYFMKLENDKEGKSQWMFALVTHFGEPLEKSRQSYDKLLPEFDEPAFVEAVRNSSPLTEIGQYKLPILRRKFFSQMKVLPEGFIAMGDAQCTWAPHAGLGLAIAAVDALQLKKTLKNDGIQNISKNYFQRSEKEIDVIWNRNITQGVIPLIGSPKPSLLVKFLCWYKKKLGEYSVDDKKIWKELMLFFYNEQSIYSLFHPSLIFRAISHAMRGNK